MRHKGIELTRLLDEQKERSLTKMQGVCPRWLHVLMPAEHQRSDEEQVFLDQLLELLCPLPHIH